MNSAVIQKLQCMSDWIFENGASFLYGLASLVIAVGVLRGETSVARYFSLAKSKKILAETVSGLEAENAHLADEITRIKTSRDYANKVLREKYHVTEDGEKIIYYAD